MAQHVEGHTVDQGQVFRRVVAAGAASILAELDVQHPMLSVFDAPVPAYRVGKTSRVGDLALLTADPGQHG